MANPVVSHNTPVAGSISWSAFGIQYNGGSYNIPAGSTANRFVWWKFNAGAPALQQGNALPSDLTADDLILFINKNGTGARVPDAALYDGSLIVGGSILAPAIAVDAINSDHIQANAITSEHIGSNTIQANMISAGAVRADRLSVGTISDNIVVNGSFEDFITGDLIGWELNANTNGTITPVTGKSSSGAVSMEMAATTTTANLRFRQKPQQFIPVSSASNRKMYVAARAAVSVALTTGFYIRVNWYDANRVQLTTGGTTDIRSNGSLTTTFTIYDGQATIPAAARYMGMEILLVNPNVVTNVYVDEVTVHEVTMTAQIGDNAITAVKIVGNTITGNQIAANSIYADKLAIADFSNWVHNGGLNMGTTFLDNWNAGTGVAVADTDFLTGRALQNTAVGNYGSRYQTKVYAVKEGDSFYAAAKVKVTATGTVAGQTTFHPTLRAMFRDKANVMIPGTGNQGTSTSGDGITPKGTVQAVEAEFVAPANAASVQFWTEMHNPAGATQTIGDMLVRRMNGGELVVDGAIYTEKLAANAVSAEKIGANAVTANAIAANAVVANHIMAGAVSANKLESELVLATKIVAGDPTKTHAEMSPEGFKVFADDPSDGIPNEVVRLGVAGTNDYFAITKADGSLAATIDQNGNGSFQKLDVAFTPKKVATDGTVTPASGDLFIGGKSFESIMWNMPRGHVGSAYRYSHSGQNSTNWDNYQPYLRYDCELEEGRLYKISTSAIRMGITSGGRARVMLMSTTGAGNVATTSSYVFTHAETDAEGNFVSLSEVWTPKLAGHIPGRKLACSFLIAFTAVSGACGVRSDISAPTRLLVEDVGPLVNTADGVWLDGSAPPPPPQKVTYVRQYGCTNSMNYRGDNTQYNYDLGHMYQGLSPAGYGNLKSIGLFPDMTADLSGASIEYIRVYFNFPHWYYNSGGTAYIGAHGHTSIPGTFSQIGTMVGSGGWPKPGARWVDLPSNTFDGFKSGAYRGLSLQGDNTYGTYGYADRPTIEIRFNK